LCPECAVDLGKGLGCRNRCEEDVRAVIKLIEQNIKISDRATTILETRKGAAGGAWTFNLVIGAVFVVWGFTDPERLMFLIILGVCFIGFGGFSFIKSRRCE
jgi:hypothetical protein